MARKSTKNPYSPHPGIAMTIKWVAELKLKTGRSLEEWLDLVQKEGPPEEKARREWLGEEFKLGTNTAWWLAERSLGKGEEACDPDKYLKAALGYVDKMFAGSKSGLRPIYEKLLQLCLEFAPDLKACPCETIVPIYRKHVVAQLKPTTRTRIDFGYALKDTRAEGRLIDTGGFAKKDRITHRIPISSLDDIDAEVTKWLRQAYDLDA